MTGTLFDGAFDGASASRRTLHRDRPGREGVEAELVSRLAAGLGPGARMPRAAPASFRGASGKGPLPRGEGRPGDVSRR